MIVKRVEKHLVKPPNKHHSLLLDFCHKAKNLYNHANFVIRQNFLKNGEWTRYQKLDKLLKTDMEYPDYRDMPTAQSAQQVLRILDCNWKSFFKSIKDYNKSPEKYLGRPKMPKYLKKNSFFVLTLTNQNVKLKPDGLLHFPKVFDDLTIIPQFIQRKDFVSFQQVRLIPSGKNIVVELVYNIKCKETKSDNKRYIAIDLGVNNLATVANNFGVSAFVINGHPLKSINQFYNKQKAHYQSILKQYNNRYTSCHLETLAQKRHNKVKDYMHKASKYIINWCIEHDVSKVIIGKNNNWKQGSNIGKKNNQTFVNIPFDIFINMLRYKAEEYGIVVVETEESYTSGTSFIDNEEPTKEFYNKRRRIHRGLFKSNDGTLINADLNGAYQIMKKVVPIKWDRGCGLHPVVVNLG